MRPVAPRGEPVRGTRSGTQPGRLAPAAANILGKCGLCRAPSNSVDAERAGWRPPATCRPALSRPLPPARCRRVGATRRLRPRRGQSRQQSRSKRQRGASMSAVADPMDFAQPASAAAFLALWAGEARRRDPAPCQGSYIQAPQPSHAPGSGRRLIGLAPKALGCGQKGPWRSWPQLVEAPDKFRAGTPAGVPCAAAAYGLGRGPGSAESGCAAGAVALKVQCDALEAEAAHELDDFAAQAGIGEASYFVLGHFDSHQVAVPAGAVV